MGDVGIRNGDSGGEDRYIMRGLNWSEKGLKASSSINTNTKIVCNGKGKENGDTWMIVLMSKEQIRESHTDHSGE